MSDRIYLGNNVENLDYGEQKVISKVILTRSSDTWYEAGDDSGATLECSNPWATQAMANAILSAVQSAPAYMPFTATDALIDPAAEIGDMVTVGGIYAEIVSIDTTLDMMSSANLSAPGVDEVDDEYPYESQADREAQRENKRIYSLITKTDSEIRLFVSNEIDGVQSEITQTATEIRSYVDDEISGVNTTITQTASSLTAQITSVDGRVTNLSANLDSIEARVQGVEGDYSSLSIRLGQISSTVSDVEGNLSTVTQTVNGLEITTNGLASGTTTINGACIKTGTISADRIDTTDLVAENIGGGSVGLITPGGSTVGNITISGSSSAMSGQGVQINAPAIGLIATSGDIYAESRGGATYIHISTDSVICRGSFVPTGSGNWNLGSNSQKWANVYATTGEIVTSDREKKTDISYDMERYDSLFDSLKPCVYRYKDGGTRLHAGLISQDVEASLTTSGLSDMDFAGFVKSPDRAGGYDYALRYAEFVPLLIYQEQKSKARIADLESRLKALEEQI